MSLRFKRFRCFFVFVIVMCNMTKKRRHGNSLCDTREREGNNYLVGGENRKHTMREKKLARSFSFLHVMTSYLVISLRANDLRTFVE